MESPKRKNNRLPNYDYGSEGCYFVTICIKDRRPILSDFVGVDVLGDPQRIKLLPYGIIADKYINQINEFYVNINVDKYVIMLDHMHILLSVTDNGAPRTSPPTRQTATVPHFVSTFKRFCNKEIGENIWQRGYYDHVIRNRQDYDEVWEYVENNPLKWALIHRI